MDDMNTWAKSIMDKISDKTKNPHAVAMGKLGGPKGGKARAEKLSAEERSDIAKKGAAARWKKKKLK